MSNVIRDRNGVPFTGNKHQIALGMWDNVSGARKFFAGLSTATKGTLCDVASNSVFSWVNPTSYGAMGIRSDNVQDTVAGSGIDTIKVFGVTNSYDLRMENITLVGSDTVFTSNSDYIHCWRMHSTPEGSTKTGDPNAVQEAGNIICTIAGTAVSQITQGNGQTLQSPYIVPNSYYAMLDGLNVVAPSGKTATCQLVCRDVAHTDSGTFTFSGVRTLDESPVFETDYAPKIEPIRFEPRTMIEMRSQLSATTSRLGGSFNMYLFPVDPGAAI